MAAFDEEEEVSEETSEDVEEFADDDF